MKKREFEQLKNSQINELRTMVRDNQLRLRTLKFDLVAGKVKNVGELTKIKKDIARMLTLINMKEREGKNA